MPFSAKTLDFLFENRLQNSKQWYDEHKPQYREYVVDPFCELVKALTDTMLKIDSSFITEPRIDRTISRIRRDTRFSRDKLLYRDTAWCCFMRNKKQYFGYPGYFFELSPGGFRYGCGYYMASPEAMNTVRDMLMKNDKRAVKALNAYKKQQIFQLEGDMYKRSRHPDEPPEKREWLDRRSICVIHNSTDFELLFSPGLADVLKNDFKAIIPVYDFLIAAETEKEHRMN